MVQDFVKFPFLKPTGHFVVYSGSILSGSITYRERHHYV